VSDVVNPAALAIDDLRVAYGPIRAVQGVTLSVAAGSVTAIVGSNGAGKSSILRAVAGMVPSTGTISVNASDISRTSALDRTVRHGVVFIPEGRSVFTTMTVEENLSLGTRVGLLRGGGGFALDEAFHLFPVLDERRKQRAQLLSGGEQQMLAIARSLLMRPDVLVIDEPSMGLAPLLVRKIFGVMRDVFAREGVSVLLVEQDTAIALELASYGYVLEEGAIVAEGSAHELRDDPRLRAAYLGGN
jgi:branched-chain amino acid transport system ATP-binding protein